MTRSKTSIAEFLKLMTAAGFTTRLMWQAREVGYTSNPPNVEGRTVFGPQGQFLAIVVMREFEGGVFVHFAPNTENQLEPLKSLLTGD